MRCLFLGWGSEFEGTRHGWECIGCYGRVGEWGNGVAVWAECDDADDSVSLSSESVENGTGVETGVGS